MNITQAFRIAALALIATCTTTQAATPPIPLHYGSNTINFGKGSETGIAMLARRENFNAHGFDVLTLYIKPAATKDDPGDWQFVSVFDGDKEALTLASSGGADCLLKDFRLIKDASNGGLSLVIAEREFGSSYADTAPVTFKFYRLKHNAEGDVGRPLYYFELASTKQVKKNYCDVGEAFSGELGVGLIVIERRIKGDTIDGA